MSCRLTVSAKFVFVSVLLVLVQLAHSVEADPPPCHDMFCKSAKVIRHNAFQWTLIIFQFFLFLVLSQSPCLQPADPNRISKMHGNSPKEPGEAAPTTNAAAAAGASAAGAPPAALKVE